MTCSMLPGLDAGGFDAKRKKLAPMWQAVCFRVALQLIWLRPNPEPEHPFGDIQLLDSGSSQKQHLALYWFSLNVGHHLGILLLLVLLILFLFYDHCSYYYYHCCINLRLVLLLLLPGNSCTSHEHTWPLLQRDIVAGFSSDSRADQ